MTLPLIPRLVPHFGEDPEDLTPTLFEVAPTVLFTVPRYLQKFASQIVGRRCMNSRPQARDATTGDALCARARARGAGRARRARARSCAYRASHGPPSSGRS